ncbi:MAG TPA: ABC transporter substrate-binding protein [Stellaceae bacterium]|nr:ABC transporter substrate-binding protein [Stellaceae bacterium]
MTLRNETDSGARRARVEGRVGARRHALGAIATAAGAAVVTLALIVPALPAPDAGPIKIGVLVPLTGNFAAPGQQTLAGLKIYFDGIGNKAGGHPLELIVEDTQGNPEVAVTKTRKLVERDGVQVLTGIVSSAVALAVSDYSRTNQVPLVLSGDAATDELTMPGKLANPYLVRLTENSRTPSAVAADFAYKTKGWRTATVITSDYVAGVDLAFAFAQRFCQLGGKVTQAQYPPLDTGDYGPYLTNLDRTANAMVVFTPGAAGLKLGRQFAEFGLKGKLPELDLFGTLTYESYLPQLGDAALGAYSALIYTPYLNTALNKSFVAEFRKRTGNQATNEGPSGWTGAHAIADAIDAVKGDLSDKTKFMGALRTAKFDTPKGSISLDKDGMVVQSMYIREVQKVGAELGNVPIATYHDIGQYWPYSETEFQSFAHTYNDSKDKLTDCAWLLAKK